MYLRLSGICFLPLRAEKIGSTVFAILNNMIRSHADDFSVTLVLGLGTPSNHGRYCTGMLFVVFPRPHRQQRTERKKREKLPLTMLRPAHRRTTRVHSKGETASRHRSCLTVANRVASFS